MPPINDNPRTVHARNHDGCDLVTYGTWKWYLEWDYIPSSLRISFDEACRFGQNAPHVYLGQPGGLRFDARYRRAFATVRPDYVPWVTL